MPQPLRDAFLRVNPSVQQLRTMRDEDAARMRSFQETWALGPHLYAVNAKEDLVENVCRAIAEGLRALAPPYP